jgi:hypothetical protein
MFRIRARQLLGEIRQPFNRKNPGHGKTRVRSQFLLIFSLVALPNIVATLGFLDVGLETRTTVLSSSRLSFECGFDLVFEIVPTEDQFLVHGVTDGVRKTGTDLFFTFLLNIVSTPCSHFRSFVFSAFHVVSFPSEAVAGSRFPVESDRCR